MYKMRFFLKMALSGLQRGGQRSFVALLTVAFGVMSLISMTSLSDSILKVIMADGRSVIGGDIQLYGNNPGVSSQELAQIEAWQAAGLISDYTAKSTNYDIVLRNSDGIDIPIYGASYGVNPESYPLIGEITLDERGKDFAAALQNPYAIVVTADIASANHLKVGDDLRLAQLSGMGVPIDVQVTGIAVDTPDHSGGHIYYSLETARVLAGREQIITDVLALSHNLEALQAAIAPTNWRSILPENVLEGRQNVRDIFSFTLKGSGILGLLVGGIGIANTLQVLLSKRQSEIAILKTLGYSQSDMLLLFLLESFILGLGGSIVGALAAFLVSDALTTVFANTGTMLINWQADSLSFLTGIMIGITMTLIFAFYTILRASEIRPALIFQQQPPKRNLFDWFKAFLVYSILMVPFSVITTSIFGDLLMGIGIILVAIAGFLGVGFLLWLTLWLGLRLLPTFQMRFLSLAQKNMKKRGNALIFAMIALFVGIYTLGFASTIIDTSWDEMVSRQIESQGYNAVFYGRLEDRADFEAASQAIDKQVRYIAQVNQLAIAQTQVAGVLELQARDVLWDVRLSGAEYTEEGVWLAEELAVPIGESISIRTFTGENHQLVVVGSYQMLENPSLLVNRSGGILVNPTTLQNIMGENIRLEWYAETSPETVQALTQSLPQIVAESSAGLNARYNAGFNNLFIFAISMSGLALLAAVMLIGNAVGLAMLERRYEIGVMKAVGYTRVHVLRIVAYEYGLIGCITSLIALIAVQVSIMLMSTANGLFASYIIMKPSTAILIFVLGLGLSIFTAILTAWEATQLKPLLVLKSQ